MKFSKASALGLMAFATLISLMAMSQESGGYFGANIGRAQADIDEARIVDDLASAGITQTSIDEDERDTGYKIFGGYRFNKYWALEGGYFDLGEFSFTATTLPAGTLSGRIKVKGVNLDLVGFIPFTEKFAAFGRAGANYAEAKDKFTATGLVNVLDPSRKERDTNYKFGVGLQYAFTPSFAMRAEAERYRINDAVGNDGDIDLFSLGVLFGFGGPAAHAAPSTTPTPVAMAEPATPPPPPKALRDSDNDGVTDDVDKCPGTPRGVAVDATGCPLKGSVTLEGINFEYNSALLTAESRHILGELAANLKKYPRLRIELQGHTDSVGSDAYNRALSQRRADSVRQYLIDHGVSADRLTARGYGETQPVDNNNTDAGRARNRRVVMDVIANPGEVRIEGEGSAR